MGSFPKPAIRVLTLGLVLFALLECVLQAESANMRPTWGRMGPPSPMAIRMRRDPPPKTMMMSASGGRPSSPRRQYYNPYYRPLQRPRKSYPTQLHYGQPPKQNPHASYSSHKNYYAPYPKQEFGNRRPPVKYIPGGSHGPPKYHRPQSSPSKPIPSFGGSFPNKNKYNPQSGRPSQNAPKPSSVAFPSSDNAQVIKGTRENPTQQYFPKPSYNGYIPTTEQNSNSDYFAAPVSTSFHAIAPGSSSIQSSSQTTNLQSGNYGLLSKPTAEVLNGIPASVGSFQNAPSIPNAFAASSGSPAVSFSFIEHGNTGNVKQATTSNYGISTSSPLAFQAPASQSFGFVPYSDNGQSQGIGLSQIVQFPATAGGRTTRKTQKTTGESLSPSPNYFDPSSSKAISVSASIPTFESHTSYDTGSHLASSNDERYTQVSYPSNHRSSYESRK